MSGASATIGARARRSIAHGGTGRVAGRSRPPWDAPLLAATAALLALGLVMVYSASIAYGTGVSGASTRFLLRHAAFVGLGVASLTAALYLRVRLWEQIGPLLLLVGIGLLVAVLIPGVGVQANGSTRWIRLGFVNVQPSEFVKLFMIVYVAGYLVRRQEALRSFTNGILMVSLVVAVIGMLLLQEPDLGSVVVICLAVLMMLFLAGVRFWHFLVVVGAGVGGMVLLTVVSPYRLGRVTSFLDPWADPFNSGFQLVQALIAFGRGEWFGVGLGASVQKLSYLPAAHTDFVFSVLAEELGLVGVLTVMVLFAVIVVRAFAIARQAEAAGESYGARLAQGLGLLIGLQALINMGVNMGVLPTKGLTLPFVSYGGSSMLASCVAIGVLARIEREARARLWGERAATEAYR